MAEAVFANMVKEASLDDVISVDSAGTGDWHAGQHPHRGTRAILAKNAISTKHTARQITRSDFDRFDFILTMDEANYKAVLQLNPRAKNVVRFMDFAVQHEDSEVPDPYYTGNFETVYQMCVDASNGLLANIRSRISR